MFGNKRSKQALHGHKCWSPLAGVDVAPPPWDASEVPSLVDLHNFSILSSVGMDLLHIWHLGVGRDVAASVMTLLLKTQFFPGSRVPGLGSCFWFLLSCLVSHL